MTEAEAWECIADTLEGLKGMPPFRRLDEPCAGLCSVVAMLRQDRLITEQVLLRMQRRIRDFQRAQHIDEGTFFFRPGSWKPRARLARRFAEEARKR